MTGRARIWFALFVVLVFVSGSFAGIVMDRLWLIGRGPGFVDVRPVGGPVGRRGGAAPDAAVDRELAFLTRTLDLTAAQQQSLQEVLQRWTNRAATLQGEARRQYAAEQSALLDEVSAVLTSEQAERFRAVRGGRLLGRLGGTAAGRSTGRGRGPEAGRRGRE